MEQELQSIYQEIAETVNEMIPEEWEKLFFYAQVSEDGGGTYFFYKPNHQVDSYIYSLEIPFKYNIDEGKFKYNKRKLFSLAEKMREIFKKEGQEIWYSFTLTLDKSGKFNIHYDYTNWFNTEYSFSDQMIIWKQKYLGEKPTEKNQQMLIDKYHNDFPNNPI